MEYVDDYGKTQQAIGSYYRHRYDDYDYYPKRYADKNPGCINLLYVNRQVYQEATQVFYSENTFSFIERNYAGDVTHDMTGQLGPLAAYTFLKDRTPQVLSYIKNIAVSSLEPNGDCRPDDTGLDAWHALWRFMCTMELDTLRLDLSLEFGPDHLF